jgi:hypothetical protein
VNNLGGLGTGIAAALLIGLGIVVCTRFGTTVTAADFKVPANPRFVLNSFGVICFGLVGLELASIMGDEIDNPQKTLPGAVAWGALRLLYVGATLTLLVAVSKDSISVLQGIRRGQPHGTQWASHGSSPVAFLLLRLRDRLGVARRLRESPSSQGLIPTCRPGWARFIRNMRRRSARIVHAARPILVVINFTFTGAGVQETFQKLSRSPCAVLIPFHVRRASEDCRRFLCERPV